MEGPFKTLRIVSVYDIWLIYKRQIIYCADIKTMKYQKYTQQIKKFNIRRMISKEVYTFDKTIDPSQILYIDLITIHGII